MSRKGEAKKRKAERLRKHGRQNFCDVKCDN